MHSLIYLYWHSCFLQNYLYSFFCMNNALHSIEVNWDQKPRWNPSTLPRLFFKSLQYCLIETGHMHFASIIINSTIGVWFGLALSRNSKHPDFPLRYPKIGHPLQQPDILADAIVPFVAAPATTSISTMNIAPIKFPNWITLNDADSIIYPT